MMHPGPHPAAPPQKPDVWGALAVSASTLDWGTSWNSKSESDASAFALRICAAKGAHDCKILKTVADVCLSLVSSSEEKIFMVGGPIGASNIAEDAALAKCRRAGGKASKLTTSSCADGVRHVLNGETKFSNGNPIFVHTGPPAGQGSFAAANGHYTAAAPKPNDSGTYQFTDSETVVCTNSAGQTVTWRRTAKPVDANTAAKAATGYQPPSSRPGTLEKR